MPYKWLRRPQDSIDIMTRPALTDKFSRGKDKKIFCNFQEKGRKNEDETTILGVWS